jgi:uncharacterized protein YjiS (DUF1127 family)
MIKQDLYGEFRLLSSPRIPQSGPLVRRHGNRLRLVLRQTRATSLRGEALRAARSHQRIVAALRLLSRHARSRQQLPALSDHLLKDIGLRREEVGYEFPQLFRHCD